VLGDENDEVIPDSLIKKEASNLITTGTDTTLTMLTYLVYAVLRQNILKMTLLHAISKFFRDCKDVRLAESTTEASMDMVAERVRQNLFDFLEVLQREAQNEQAGTTSYWIDALCIDQRNDLERKSSGGSEGENLVACCLCAHVAWKGRQ
jgi:hypothetical protein